MVIVRAYGEARYVGIFADGYMPNESSVRNLAERQMLIDQSRGRLARQKYRQHWDDPRELYRVVLNSAHYESEKELNMPNGQTFDLFYINPPFGSLASTHPDGPRHAEEKGYFPMIAMGPFSRYTGRFVRNLLRDTRYEMRPRTAFDDYREFARGMRRILEKAVEAYYVPSVFALRVLREKGLTTSDLDV